MLEPQGWIKLHRKILENPLFSNPQAFILWMQLLLRANHKDAKVMLGNQVVEVKRGQLLTGRNKLSEYTGLNRSKLERLLDLFENEQQIEQQKTTKYRLISITNYDKYQGDEQQLSNKRATTEQQLSTNKNDNNNKNEKKKESIITENKFSDDDMRLAKFIFEKILVLNPKAKQPNFNSWAETIRITRQMDNRTHKELQEVFLWANKDLFWQKNILSPAKLRAQFDSLVIKMKPTIKTESQESQLPESVKRALEKARGNQ